MTDEAQAPRVHTRRPPDQTRESDAVRAEWERKADAGATATAIAAEYGVSPSTVSAHLKSTGRTTRKPKPPKAERGRGRPAGISPKPAWHQKAQEMRAAGKTSTEIAAIFNVSPQAVRLAWRTEKSHGEAAHCFQS